MTYKDNITRFCRNRCIGFSYVHALVRAPKCHRSQTTSQRSLRQPKKIWEDLKKRYLVANLPKIHQLKLAIAKIANKVMLMGLISMTCEGLYEMS